MRTILKTSLPIAMLASLGACADEHEPVAEVVDLSNNLGTPPTSSCRMLTEDCTDCAGTLVYEEPGVDDTLPSYPQWQTGGLSLDADTIYFDVCDFYYDQCFIKSVPKTGGAATTYGGGDIDASGVTLVNDQGTIYTGAYCTADQTDWCDLVAIPKDGDPIRVVADSQVGLPAIVEDANALYWFGYDGSTGTPFGIQSVGKDGSGQRTLLSVADDPLLTYSYFVKLAEFGDDLYYGYSGDFVPDLGQALPITIMRVSKHGGAPTMLYQRSSWLLDGFPAQLQSLDVDAHYIYWTEQAGNSHAQIWRLSRVPDSAPELIVQTEPGHSLDATGMTVDGHGDVLWGEWGNQDSDFNSDVVVKKWFHSDGHIITLGQFREHVLTAPLSHIVADRNAVYVGAGATRFYKFDTCVDE